jgi:ribosomal RNA-processing protein 17
MEDNGEQQRKLGKHVPKRALRNKSLIITFDENDRREFVTGFHKRKKQRRKLAEQQQQIKEREKRLADRKRRRLAIKLASGEITEVPDENPKPSSAGDISEQEDDGGDSNHGSIVNGTLTYEDGDITTIVNTCELNSENEDVETSNPNVFPNPKSKIKIPIPAKKNKSFKKVKKGKKINKKKVLKKGTSRRLGKKGKDKR